MTETTKPSGEAPTRMSRARNYVIKDLQKWSFVHYAFDLGITAIFTTLISELTKMNWVSTAMLSVAIFWSFYFGMAVWRYEQDRQRSLKAMNTDDPFTKAIERIRSAETHQDLNTAIEAASRMLEAFQGHEQAKAFWTATRIFKNLPSFDLKQSVAIAYLEGTAQHVANQQSTINNQRIA